MRSTAILSRNAVTGAMERALACLRTSFRANPAGDAGWYHYLDDPNPGVTASAVGLFCFQMAGVRFERTDDVRRYLIGQQVSSGDSTDGGWPVRTTNGFPIVEATAWVVRALSAPSVGLVNAGEALARGARYLEVNQNTDFGWGSYLGQPSRVFHTALSMLALQECGGSAAVIENAQKWLINAQNPSEPAWGCRPGAEPTVLHTSFALLALLNIPGALSASSVRGTVEWLIDRIRPGQHVERATSVEEFDVPYPYRGQTAVFQNSLPHFAGPVALTAILQAAVNPLRQQIFATVQGILDSQLTDGTCAGAWELPRSPTRPSVWAIWPFLAALRSARSAIFTSPDTQATLLFDGCAILQPVDSQKEITRALLLRNALFDWARRHRFAVALSSIALASAGIPVGMLLAGALGWKEFTMAMVIPVLLLVFQLVWGVAAKGRRGTSR